jgi:hypothetical protein
MALSSGSDGVVGARLLARLDQRKVFGLEQ